MNKFIKILLITVGILFLGGAIFIGVVYSAFSFDNMCRTKYSSSVNSPDKKFKVMVFSLNCGAISDFSTQISIVKSEYKLKDDDTGNIFSGDSDHSLAKMNDEVLDMNIKWINDKTVEIIYPKRARIFKNKESLNGIKIIYKVDELNE